MKRALLFTVLGIMLATAAYADITDIRFALHRKDTFVSSKTIPSLCDNPSTTTVEPNYSPNYDGIPCTQYEVTGIAPGGNQLYVVVAGVGPIGVAGVSYGVDYDGRAEQMNGVDPRFSIWTACADGLAFPNEPTPPSPSYGEYPAPKGGIRITWTLPNSCQREEVGGVTHAVVGSIYVYAYAEDVVRLTPNNNLQSGPEVAVTDCGGSTTELIALLGGVGVDVNLVLGRVHLGGDGSQGYTPCGVVPTAATTWGKIKTLYQN